MLKIGSHVSFSDKGLLTATAEATSYGSSSFMIYTGAPQNTRRKPIDSMFIEEGKAAMQESGIDEIVVHAPYIINLGSYKPNTFELAVSFLQEEIRRTHAVGVKNIVLHPGAYTDKDAEYGIDRIAEGLNEVLGGTDETEVKIALETMAGKGTEMGRSFEEIASIIDKVKYNDRLAICLDTCHIHDAGYDIVNDLDGVLEQFDKLIGLDRLTVVHVNDSKNPRGAGKDRHTPIGTGWIGYEAIQRVVHHEKLQGRPFILETPWIGKDPKPSVRCTRSRLRFCAGMWKAVSVQLSRSKWKSWVLLPRKASSPVHLCWIPGRCLRMMPKPKGRSARTDGAPVRYDHGSRPAVRPVGGADQSAPDRLVVGCFLDILSFIRNGILVRN